MQQKEISEALAIAENELEDQEHYAFQHKGWDVERIREYLAPYRNVVKELRRSYRLVQKPEMTEKAPYGDRMTLQEFVFNCECGGFIDYDGFGVYATETQDSNIEVYPSDVKNGCLRTDFTHINWFNR